MPSIWFDGLRPLGLPSGRSPDDIYIYHDEVSVTFFLNFFWDPPPPLLGKLFRQVGKLFWQVENNFGRWENNFGRAVGKIILAGRKIILVGGKIILSGQVGKLF